MINSDTLSLFSLYLCTIVDTNSYLPWSVEYNNQNERLEQQASDFNWFIFSCFIIRGSEQLNY